MPTRYSDAMSSPILSIQPLGFPWVTFDPFLFCVHHDDPYPKANGRFGPAASLSGHAIGQDFQNADGWRMYHGEQVPGFPGHPHRGFETVTVVRRGLVDHSDSLGAAARYGGALLELAIGDKGSYAYVNFGRWVADCAVCPSALEVKPGQAVFACLDNLCRETSELVWPAVTVLGDEDLAGSTSVTRRSRSSPRAGPTSASTPSAQPRPRPAGCAACAAADATCRSACCSAMLGARVSITSSLSARRISNTLPTRSS